MGLFGGSTTTKTNETFDTGPSSFQKPYLDASFGAAQSAYNKSAGTPYYQGETYAGMDEATKKALEALKGYASTQGLHTANQMSAIGSSMAGYGTAAGSTMDRFAAMAGEDPTQDIISRASQYASNPQIDAMVDGAARDVTRNLSEDILPAIDRRASATGNINSSRAGVASGIAQRGAADRVADISASIRGDAYNRGLSLAQGDWQSRLAALRDASSGYGDLASLGVNTMRQGAEAGYDAYGQITNANLVEQQDRQGQLDADFSKWQGEDTREFDLINRLYGVVGSGQWGQSGTSSGTSKSKTNQSLLSGILGAASTAAGIYTGMKSKRMRPIDRNVPFGSPLDPFTYPDEPVTLTDVRKGPVSLPGFPAPAVPQALAAPKLPAPPPRKRATPFDSDHISETLLAIGQGFLSSQNFGEGLGNANAGILGQMDRIRRENAKSVEYGGPDSQFEITTDASGNRTVRKVPEFAEAVEAKRDAAKKPSPKDNIDLRARAVYAISQLPAEQRQAAYSNLLANSAQYGIDVTDMPPAWSDEYGTIMGTMGMNVNQSLANVRSNAVADSTIKTNAARVQQGDERLQQGRTRIGQSERRLNAPPSKRGGRAATKAKLPAGFILD